MERFLEDLFGDQVTPQRRIAVFTTPDRHTRFFDRLGRLVDYARRRSPSQNVYFGVGLVQGEPKGRGRRDDICAIGALWCDIDIRSPVHPKENLPRSLEEAHELLRQMPLAPSIVIDSGHGLHAYWLLHESWIFESDEERKQAARLAKAWHGLVCRKAAQRAWSLENLGDLTRVLRLPGTLNHNGPGEPVEVRILESDPNRRYAPDDFEPFLPPEEEAIASGHVTVDALVLRPDAEPPAIKLLEAASQSPLFWQTWNRRRPDLPDQSQSGYDLSLATLAALRGWTDQQIANLIIAARRHHGQKPEKALREDYIRRTLAKAKQAAASLDPAGGQIDLSALLGQANSAGPAAPDPSFPTDRPPPEPESIGQLLQDHPQLRAPVIHGLLREGETMNVISVPKLGKSWLVIDLALAVATGRPWLERFETEPGQVLMIDNELHPETTANRIPKVARARGIPLEQIAERVFVENLRGRLHDLISLKPYLLALPPGRFRIVILDAFYRFLPPGTDENDNGSMANLYNHLDECAARLEASFVLIHHTTKGSQSGKSVTDVGAGAGSQSRATDTHLVMRPHEEQDVVVLEAAVRSWPPVEPICLRWTFPVWTPDDSLDPTALRSERPKRKRNAASDQQAAESSKPQWTPKDFAASLVNALPQTKAEILAQANQEGLSDYQATRLLAKAEALGLIHRWHLGGNRPGFATGPQPANHEEPGSEPCPNHNSVDWFVCQRCVIAPSARVPRDDLYEAYLQWSQANGVIPEDRVGFGRAIRAAVPAVRESQHRVSGKRVRYYEGIDLGGARTRCHR